MGTPNPGSGLWLTVYYRIQKPDPGFGEGGHPFIILNYVLIFGFSNFNQKQFFVGFGNGDSVTLLSFWNASGKKHPKCETLATFS